MLLSIFPIEAFSKSSALVRGQPIWVVNLSPPPTKKFSPKNLRNLRKEIELHEGKNGNQDRVANRSPQERVVRLRAATNECL